MSSAIVYKCFEFLGKCAQIPGKITEQNYLLTEMDHAYKMQKELKRYLKQVQKLENKYGLSICYIKDIQNFSDDFDKFYKETLDYKFSWSDIQKDIWPEWYRKELAVYVNTLKGYFSNLQSLYMDLKLDIKDVEKIKNKTEREEAFKNLRKEMKWLKCEDQMDFEDEDFYF